MVSGSVWNPGFHKLCGINPDQHFYLHLDKSVGFQHIDFTITSVTPGVPYKFGLWISQVDCFEGSSIMAPGGLAAAPSSILAMTASSRPSTSRVSSI